MSADAEHSGGDRRKSSRLAAAEGGCMCGAVRFTAKEVKTRYGACHCGMCRRWSGGVWFGTEAKDVTFEDDAAVGVIQSSPLAERGFCKKCGAALFYRMPSANVLILSVGAFDDQTPFELVSEIFIDCKPAGFALAGAHKTMTEAEVLAAFASAE